MHPSTPAGMEPIDVGLKGWVVNIEVQATVLGEREAGVVGVWLCACRVLHGVADAETALYGLCFAEDIVARGFSSSEGIDSLFVMT